MSYGGGGVPVGATATEVAAALLAALGVPGVDSVNNVTVRDVVGQKGDTINGDSLYAKAVLAASQVALTSSCYPGLATGVTVVSANADWVLGDYATVIPASTVTNPFRVTEVSVEACNRDASFFLELTQGDGNTVISETRFTVENGYFGNVSREVSSGLLTANARVRARLASSNGLAQIATIKISVSLWPY